MWLLQVNNGNEVRRKGDAVTSAARMINAHGNKQAEQKSQTYRPNQQRSQTQVHMRRESGTGTDTCANKNADWQPQIGVNTHALKVLAAFPKLYVVLERQQIKHSVNDGNEES